MLTLEEIKTELTDAQYENFVQACMYENLLGSVEEVEAFILSREFKQVSEALDMSFDWGASRKGLDYWINIYKYLKVRSL